jgi:signal transduction histidine kinase
MPECTPSAAIMGLPPGPELAPGLVGENREFLLRAFRSFAEAAQSLELSYAALQAEVARLRGELQASHAGLKRSLEENRQMRCHLDRILDGLPCGVLVAGPSGEISLANPEARRLLGANPASGQESDWPSNQVPHEILDNNNKDALDSLASVPGELYAMLLRARHGPTEQEQCFRDACGGERWLAVRHAAVPAVIEGAAAPSGPVSIFILRDISEAKRLVAERDRMRREQALAEMSAILAHEVRNPLGTLELFAGLLAAAGLSPECHSWVEQVQAGLRTLAATVNNVLHFHSLPAPQRTPTDLGQLLEWAGGFLLPIARQARVELCLHNRLHGVWLAADRHRLEQVLLNLMLNALRAMPGGGWVEIAGHVASGRATVSVSDTGPGISSADFGKIFDAGFSTRPGSPGLGLAVCRKILEQHGGALVAANRTGAGASFTLTLPLGERGPAK